MKDSLKKTLDAINKKHPGSIGIVSEMPTLDIERMTTGSHYLDWATGGGWPRGRIIELYGNPSTGKSTITLKTIAAAQKKGLICAFIDAENAFDPDYATLLGVNLESLILSQAMESEEIYEQAFALAKGGVDLIVIDSVASMVPKAQFEADMDKPTIALSARSMSRGLPILIKHSQESKTTVIFTNQIRLSPGAYGNPEVTAGGKALGFYASVRVEVRRGDFIKQKEENIGHVVKFKIVKNKTAPPYRQGEFNFLYSGVIDRIDELISVGIITGNIGRRGAYYDVGGESFQGRDALYNKFKEDNPFYSKFAKAMLNVAK